MVKPVFLSSALKKAQNKALRLVHFPSTAEPKGVVPELPFALVVEGDALVLRNVVPGRAANQLDLPARWPGRILRGAVLVIVLAVPVVYPLPLVSKHVE
jgi:hypothetical protein